MQHQYVLKMPGSLLTSKWLLTFWAICMFVQMFISSVIAQDQATVQKVANSLGRLWGGSRKFEFESETITERRYASEQGGSVLGKRYHELVVGKSLDEFFHVQTSLTVEDFINPDVSKRGKSRTDVGEELFTPVGYLTYSDDGNLYLEDIKDVNYYPPIGWIWGKTGRGYLPDLVRQYTRKIAVSSESIALDLQAPEWSGELEVRKVGSEFQPSRFVIIQPPYRWTTQLGEFQQVGDTKVLTSWEQETEGGRTNRHGQKSVGTHHKVTVSAVANPDLTVEDLQFVADIKDGTPVTVMDSQWLHHEWRDGKVVQVTDPEAMKRLDNFKFVNQQSTSHWWWMVGGGFILVVAAGLVWKFRSMGVLLFAIGISSVAIGQDDSTVIEQNAQKSTAIGSVGDSQSLMGWDEPYCGIVSAWGVLKHFGKAPEMQVLIDKRYVGSWDGSTGQQLINVLEDYGVESESFIRANPGTLSSLRGPAILHTRSRSSPLYRHWVLFLGFENEQLRIVDPSYGLQLLSAAELQAQWDGLMIIPERSRSSSFTILSGTFLRFVPYLLIGSLCVGSFYFLAGRLFQGRFSGSVLGAVGMLIFGSIGGIIGSHLLPSGLNSSPAAVSTIAGLHPGEFLREVNSAELQTLVDRSDADTVLVDCRFRSSFLHGSIPRAINIPVDATVMEESLLLQDIPLNSRIILFCQSEHCSYDDYVARRLIGRGYQNLEQYPKGINGWHELMANAKEKSNAETTKDQT